MGGRVNREEVIESPAGAELLQAVLAKLRSGGAEETSSLLIILTDLQAVTELLVGGRLQSGN